MPQVGVNNSQTQALNKDVTNSTVLVNTDLIIPIAANTKFIGRAFLGITLAGAASGAKVQVTVPAGGTAYMLGYKIINGNSGTVVQANIITASAAFSNALANATNHYITFHLSIVNGTTAGNITVQFAQLVADAATATLLANSWISGTLLAP